MNKILIVQTAFLGDVILATPVVSELKRIYPQAQIDFLVKKGNESLLLNNQKLHEIIVFDKSKGKWKSILKLISRFRKDKYDLVINLHRFGSSGIITGLSKAKRKYGFKKNPFSFLYTKSYSHTIGDGTHETNRNLALIKEFGANLNVRPELFPSDQEVENVEHLITETYYCIAPASVWFTKQLPKEKWVELINKISTDKVIYLLGGKEDYALCEEIYQEADRSNIKNLAGELNLLESCALMRTATRNYVNDSGPLHLASSMNANVTAFFCSTIPAFGFGPLSDDSQVVEVLNLACRPCGLHGHSECPKSHFKCGFNVDISKVEL